MPRSLALLVGIGLALSVAGCERLPPTVALDMTASVTGSSLEVEGTTDLPDSALLAYEVRHEQLAHDTETPLEMLFTEGTFEVTGGRFGGPIDLSQFDAGDLELLVAFRMDLPGGRVQTRALRSRFGSRGEKLDGPNVTTLADGGRRVALTRPVKR